MKMGNNIEIAHIFPLGSLTFMGDQKFNMLLTHLAMKYPFYKEYAKKLSETSYTILDNSLIENNGTAMSLEDVLSVAEDIRPKEIILPDIFLDAEATKKSTTEALKQLRERYGENIPYNLMGVVQGKTFEEIQDMVRFYNAIPDIHTIGIPKILSKYHPEGRPGFESAWLMSNTHHKDIHLLGLYYSFSELDQYKYPEEIRSVDTCHYSYLAKHHLGLDGVRPDGFTVDLENDVIDIGEYRNVK